jgi:hypothetical protein
VWTEYLSRDSDGNPVPPRFSRLLFFDVNGTPTTAHARLLEAALRTLERGYQWRPSGLLFTAAWGHSYFTDVLHAAAPVPAPSLQVTGPLDISAALRWRGSRSGFVGTGLPAGRQDVNGIPAGHPVPAGAPLYMGFKSGLTRNQATEDDVTISAGSFAGGTTMHVSYPLRRDRPRPDLGHRPPRRPAGHRAARLQTADGGLAGLHFVSLQRTIEDFVSTRTAMNATSAQLNNPSITDTVNNGINEFIFVLNVATTSFRRAPRARSRCSRRPANDRGPRVLKPRERWPPPVTESR